MMPRFKVGDIVNCTWRNQTDTGYETFETQANEIVRDVFEPEGNQTYYRYSVFPLVITQIL